MATLMNFHHSYFFNKDAKIYVQHGSTYHWIKMTDDDNNAVILHLTPSQQIELADAIYLNHSKLLQEYVAHEYQEQPHQDL